MYIFKNGQSWPLFIYFRLFHITQFKYKLRKVLMVCLRLEPKAARWKAQTNTLSYGGTPIFKNILRRSHFNGTLFNFILGQKNLRQINVKNDPSSIRCWDSNSQPLDHQSPPVANRRWLLP